jgi:hypothetical protein
VLAAVVCTLLFCLAFSSGEKAQSLMAITYKGPADLTLHEPIVVQFSIENGSPELARLDLGLDRKENFIIEIGQPDGVRVQARQFPMHDGLNRRGRVSVASGDRYQQKLVLNDLSSFDQTGSSRDSFACTGSRRKRTTGRYSHNRRFHTSHGTSKRRTASADL